MRQIISITISIFTCLASLGQTNTFPNSGNVGIGTTSPGYLLNVYQVQNGETSIGISNYNYGAANTRTAIIFNGYRDVSPVWPLAKIQVQSFTSSAGELAQNGSMNFFTGGYDYGGLVNRMTISPNGNIGIGTLFPSSYQHGGNNVVIEISNSNTVINSQAHLVLSSNTSVANSSIGTLTWALPSSSASYKGVAYVAGVTGAYSSATNPSAFIEFATRNTTDVNWSERMRISESGNVGIGTSNPQSLLSVNGTITGKQITVTQTGWSDFIFDKDYRLKPLPEVENYIHQHNHLPDVPAATEIESKGLNLGDMESRQMQKIEELTLYVIEQDKRITQMKQEIAALTQQMKDDKMNMNKRILALEAQFEDLKNGK